MNRLNTVAWYTVGAGATGAIPGIAMGDSLANLQTKIAHERQACRDGLAKTAISTQIPTECKDLVRQLRRQLGQEPSADDLRQDTESIAPVEAGEIRLSFTGYGIAGGLAIGLMSGLCAQNSPWKDVKDQL